MNLQEAGRAPLAAVGGKAAHLAALSMMEGVRVPPGVCVTTAAWQQVVAALPSLDGQLEALAKLQPTNPDHVRELSAQIRHCIEQVAMPDELVSAVSEAIGRLGERHAYAIRSSATAEDLPTASFAGQHDSYLNVVGAEDILRHIARCWASLFTERAVSYRHRPDIDHRTVEMAVVVQRMVAPTASGVLFTADPLTGNRRVAFVEATLGLAEEFVSGRASADAFKVRDGRIIHRALAAKQVEPALLDPQVLDLVALGRRIEAHFSSPQDIEWCLDSDGFHFVQSRPITTLFPVPELEDPNSPRVFVSVGHQQMMTDPMTPLGLSLWQLTSPAPMHVAGGRLFVDVTARLSSPETRAATVEALGRSDPRIGDALKMILERSELLPSTSADGPIPHRVPSPPPSPPPLENDPAIVAGLIEQNRTSVAELARDLERRRGVDLFDFIRADLHRLKALLFEPLSLQAVMAGIEATFWLNDTLKEWLGEHNAADVLSLAAPNNVTAEMGLALLDVADVIRAHPATVAVLREVQGDDFLEALTQVTGGEQARDAIVAWLDTYGMRCIGEIDIGRPRWIERPSALVPLILSNVLNFEPGERARRLERGREQAHQREQALLSRLRLFPEGPEKAAQTAHKIERLRTFIGYREYPKYGMVRRYFLYKQALLAEAARLVADGILRATEDIFFLTFDELQEVVRSRRSDAALIARRRIELRRFAALAAPRVLTSEGEALDGAFRRDGVPEGALVGLAVSSGCVEGRARVIHDVAEAALQPGDILVTPHTDPSWSPLFVTIAGLVTEAGGLMTHGAVIAREYGLAAVVCVEGATRRIRDGQRIRVDGARGFVELIEAP